MFRKSRLRKTLTRVGRQLKKSYGASPFYTLGQVETTMNNLKLVKDRDYSVALFVDPKTGKQEEVERITNIRASLYRYFNPNILDVDIETNQFHRILKIDESSPRGAHTQLDVTPGVFSSTSNSTTNT